jgi:type II secretory pathway pseudopilin PulG
MATKKTTEPDAKSTDATDLIDEWLLDSQWRYNFTIDYMILANLVGGVAMNNVKNAPRVGDTRLGNDVKQLPRASIQQIPTFGVPVNGTRQSIKSAICEYIVRREILNQDQSGVGILATVQLIAESALTYGWQASMAQLSTQGRLTTDMAFIHYSDIAIERGVLDFAKSGYFYVRTRISKGKLKQMIANLKKKKNTSWNVAALQKMYDDGPQAYAYSLRDSSVPQFNELVNSSNNMYNFITRYSTGPYYDIDVFSPNSEEVLRHTTSRSKFGYNRVTALVLDPNPVSPFGMSRVRLASPAANFNNIYLQSVAKMLLLNADAPIEVRGQYLAPVRLRRGAKWETLDPQASVTIKELSNSTLQQFQEVLQYTESQVDSVMGVSPATAAGSGGSYVNTVQAQAQQAVQDSQTTQFTNALENYLRQYVLTALDLYISEQQGEGKIILDDQAKDIINNIQPGAVSPENEYALNWDDFYAAIQTWTVDIDLSMGKKQENKDDIAQLQDELTVLRQTSNPNDPVAMDNANKLEQVLIQKTAPEISNMASPPSFAQPQAPGQAALPATASSQQ